jgi:hypothetical protein
VSDRRMRILLERRTDLRYEISKYKISGLGVDALSSGNAAWCRLERAPLERQLASVESELRDLGWRNPYNLASFLRFFFWFCVILFALGALESLA